MAVMEQKSTETAINVMNWDRKLSGLQEEQSPGGQHLRLYPGEPLTLHYPGVHQANHWSQLGFVPINTYSVDLRDWHGLEVEVVFPATGVWEVMAEIGLLVNKSPLPEEIEYVASRSLVAGTAGKQTKALFQFKQFGDRKALSGKWRFVRSARLSAVKTDGDAAAEPVCVEGIRLIRRPVLYVHAPVLSHPAQAGGAAEYDVRVCNCTDERQAVHTAVERNGWETMETSVEPPAFVLEPGETRGITVRVTVPERVAPGGHAVQKLLFTPSGQGNLGETLVLTTVRELPRPFIKLAGDEWEAVLQKVKEQDWAKELLEMYVRRAEEWTVPGGRTGDYLFQSHHAHEAENAAIAWKLTGRRELGEKALDFLRQVIHPVEGYPLTRKACSQELVHEGEFFKHTAVVYDLLDASGLLTDTDRGDAEHSFRLFMDLIDWALSVGGISNWTLAEMIGALYCSQALQDMERMNRFLYGTGGFTDHLSKGTLDDGWWYECSVGYNLMSAGLFSEIVQSCRPWGINLAETWVPAMYYGQVTPGAKPEKDGLCLDIWGPSRLSYRSIPQIWDSLLPFADYRGVLFGINDSAESKLPGIAPRGYMDARYDLAYYLYRKPEYADVLLTCSLADRDLLYAVPGIESSASKPYLTSAHADNAGVAVLRSRTEGREPERQIQAVVKYGSHGGAHGHYDRVSLLSIMRYGRSFYNPENIWYSYHTFMYKFYVQTSITHNMVVVDRKQQDPVEGSRLLFHSGKLFQACAVENKARWSYPPYGGWRVDGDKTFAERTWNEARYMPIPENPPEYSARTGFTEPVLQRRLTVVTDDYVVLFDYMAGEEEHEYDCLFHCKGLVRLEAEGGVERKRHTDQFDPDPLGSAQLITDCHWYELEGTVKAHFETGFGPGFDNRANRTEFNTDGPLNMDHYTVWPPQVEVIIGNDPELYKVDKRLEYQVIGDGKVLAEGKFGAWILGRDDLKVPLEGVAALELRVRTEEGIGEHGIRKTSEKTIFWGDPYVETEDGEILYLADLPLLTENTDPGNGIGVDYFGGPVKLASRQYDKAVPANPADTEQAGVITVDLSGLRAVRFVASIGGDYPLGDEAARRKMLSARSTGKTARFITVIEPYEDQPVVVSAVASSADELTVKLADGRVQVIRVTGMEGSGADLAVELVESGTDGGALRNEWANA
ncbi:MAG: hypothetical protein K0Q90_3739 [Paenibacillaceae bacterium]|nr:hypothetical protein [Paenibacillaceae bacterium]